MKIISIDIPLDDFRISLVGNGYTLDDVLNLTEEELTTMLKLKIRTNIASEYDNAYQIIQADDELLSKYYKYIAKDIHETVDPYLPNLAKEYSKAYQLQIAVNALVHGWYVNGDVYDNTNTVLIKPDGNNVSAYANWIYNNYPELQHILYKIFTINNISEYPSLLLEITDYVIKDRLIERDNNSEMTGSVFTETGIFKCRIYPSDDDSNTWNDEDED